MVSRASIAEIFQWAGADEHIAHQAARNIYNQDTTVITVTGKLASGKDTMAPLLMKRVAKTPESQHAFFARALKDEVTEAIEFLLSQVQAADVDNSVKYLTVINELSALSRISVADAQVIYNMLLGDLVSDNPPVNAYARTAGVRLALQYWGTDIRRKEDDAYWIRKSLRPMAPLLAQGVNIFVTDARFFNEIEALRSILSFTSRLIITEETQSRRLMARDGLVLTDEAKNHKSETELDSYEHFDSKVDNNEDGSEAMERVLDQLQEDYAKKIAA